jgi:hypothetical protein
MRASARCIRTAHLGLAPADVAWKNCALRTAFCDPRRSVTCAAVRLRAALQLCVSRESEVAATETRSAGVVHMPMESRVIGPTSETVGARRIAILLLVLTSVRSLRRTRT